MKKKYISPQTYIYDVSPLQSIALGNLPTGSGEEIGEGDPAAKGTGGSNMWEYMDDED